MSLFFSKLSFIHRRLWDRDGVYRVALLLGPAPLIGCGVAAGIWFMSRALPAPLVQPPDWGKPPQAAENWSTTGEPQTVQPARPIPPVGANGGLSGYESGWRATTRAIEVSPTFNTRDKADAFEHFRRRRVDHRFGADRRGRLQGHEICWGWIWFPRHQNAGNLRVISSLRETRRPGCRLSYASRLRATQSCFQLCGGIPG